MQKAVFKVNKSNNPNKPKKWVSRIYSFIDKKIIFFDVCFVTVVTMFKLLGILFIIKLYAPNDIFKLKSYFNEVPEVLHMKQTDIRNSSVVIIHFKYFLKASLCNYFFCLTSTNLTNYYCETSIYRARDWTRKGFFALFPIMIWACASVF